MPPKAKKSTSELPLRMGPWTPEEVAYTHRLSQDFQLGLLEDVRQGMSLRQWLSQMLNCSPMRISKKFEVEPSLRARCNYVVNWQRIKNLTPHEVFVRKKELETLERNFKRSTESQDYMRLMQSMRNCYDKYRKGPKKPKATKRQKALQAKERKKSARVRIPSSPDYNESTSSSSSSPATSSPSSPPRAYDPSFSSSDGEVPSSPVPRLVTLNHMDERPIDHTRVHAVFQEYLTLMQTIQTHSTDAVAVVHAKECLDRMQSQMEELSQELGMTPLTIGVLNAIQAGICIANALTDGLNDSSAIETLLRLSRSSA